MTGGSKITGVVPEITDIRANSIAIVAWDEGTGGQIHSWIEDTGYHVACFVHADDMPPNVDVAYERPRREAKTFDFPENNRFKGLPLISSRNWPTVLSQLGIDKALVMCGDQRERLRNIELARAHGITLVNAIHPTVTIMKDAIIHDNVALFARAYVGYRAEIHSGVLINTGSQVDHHNVIHPCAHIDTGVTTAGNVVIERFARIHTGAKIINNIRIGEGTVVGAGALIIKHVPPRVTVVGVPARVIKHHDDAASD